MGRQLTTIIKLSVLFFGIYFSSAIASASMVSSIVPAAPEFDVKSYILMDANSGTVIANKNSDERVAPASLTKIMTLYLVADALRSRKIHLDDQVIISEKAWRTGGSRMFIQVGSNVSVHDLIKGIAIASGNDATVAMAEHLAGSELAFVGIMNRTAHDLKMNNTSFADSGGFSDGIGYSTAYDLARLSKEWLKSFPEYYPWFKDKWIVYNNIKQLNRNRLLWHDPSVDGIKTGHTEKAGYCLISSAKHDDMRLILVVMGAQSDSVRTNCSLALLNYGFRYFESHKLFAANTKVNTVKVLFGKKNTLDIGLQEDFYITLPKEQFQGLKAKANINSYYKAPISKGQNCGTLNILLDNKIVATKPLIALQTNPRAGFIFTVLDYVKMLFYK
ncbi:MAG: D-alanyl-D-alanine carboxypeptidase [Coxiellaceae bacterium]|jgi:D-alanyl-D-alanine carboxypeptidase (penicillin-binding protein 5/6)|nr:D-alanyl-D-alanine carboxypeptidase [Coxiellaceae bacterium]